MNLGTLEASASPHREHLPPLATLLYNFGPSASNIYILNCIHSKVIEQPPDKVLEAS